VETFLVTATPPTPNGDLHVGHLSGPFLAADVFSRFQRMRGRRSVFATGSDDHQTYVPTTAAREESDPAALADAYTKQIQATLEAADIRVDCFARALGNAAHREVTQALFGELVNKGIFVRKRRAALRCDACERSLFEGFVRGWCPRCGEETPGHLCEMCGWVNDPVDLVEPTCSLCHGAPRAVEREGFFLPLERHRRRLEGFWSTRTTWRPHLLALCEEMLAQPLPEYPVSYPGGWGVPVPAGGLDREVVNVWLEMYAGHVLAGRASVGAGEASSFTLVQFLGHDNSFYNAVLHPTVALALGNGWPLPEHLVTNEFYFLGDRKFSTSRKHTIPGQEAVAMVGPDCLRFHLARSNPERWQTAFSQDALLETERREIRGVWTSAIGELHGLARQALADRPARASDLRIAGLLEGARSDLERYYDLAGFSLRRASAVLLDLAMAGGDFARRDPGAKPAAVSSSKPADAAILLRSLALFSAPLLPRLSQEIWERLNAKGKVADQPWPIPALG
jgi:methionyl-tRNA synthetase